MQGKKEYAEKLFLNFRLSERVPKENFYRQLKGRLNLSHLGKLTEKYYGKDGHKSIDTEVFFKFMLIGYLENINSDRQIVETAKMRLDMLYFLGYDLDEPLPWHSTLSRTRQLFGQEVFLELFRNILKMCVEKGMVSGKIQAVDSAFIKANASMDSLIERELNEKSKQYYNELTENEEDKNIRAYIPTLGQYIPEREGFTYNTEEDCYICSHGVKLPFKRIRTEKGRTTACKEYWSSTADCKDCPLKKNCCKSMNYKTLKHTIDKAYYDKAYQLLKTRKGKQKMRLRASTVEPVWGTLLCFRRLKKVYTKGNDLANKQVLMAAAAYNLKKLICFKRVNIAKNAIKNITEKLILSIFYQVLPFLTDIFFYLKLQTLYNMELKNRKWELCNEHLN